MADKIELEVVLKDNLKQLESTMQKAGVNSPAALKAAKGANLALESGNIKDFQKYFNQLAAILKNALAATGNISDALKKAVEAKDAISKRVNELKDQRSALIKKAGKDPKIGTGPSASELNKELRAQKDDLKKLGDATVKTYADFDKLHEKLTKFLNGRGISTLTNADAKSLGLNDRSGAFAVNRIGQHMNSFSEKWKNDKADELDKLNKEIADQTQAETKAANEIDKLQKSSLDSAEAVRELYLNIDKLTTATANAITADKAQKAETEAAALPKGTETQFEDLDKPIAKKVSGNNDNILGKAFKQFTLYAVALRAIKKAVGEAVSTIKELDKSLTEQAMVTGKTRKQTYELLSTYQQLAAQTGATTREVAELATQFMRQGKTTQEALTLTQAAMDAAKVAGISATDSVNYLTTALNGFQMSAEDAMSVSDKFAAIAANSATSYDEIATALSKVASQANLAGMSIDYTTALLAKGLETTREAPETMGTALKTVIARMREIKDYGETLSGDTDVNNVESQLAYVGIALRDVNGELRSTEDVLNDLGTKWDTLNSNQQAAVAKALAGTRQQSRLIAMMTDYERVIELQEISQRSAGATLSQMSTYLEGMSAALNKVSIAWEKIVTSIANNDLIIGIVNSVANVLDTIGSILKNEWVTAILIANVIAASIPLLIQKWETQKSINRAALQERKTKIEAAIQEKKDYLATLNKLKSQKQLTKEIYKQQLIANNYSAEQAEALANQAMFNQGYLDVEAEIKKTEVELGALQVQQIENSIELQQNAAGFASFMGDALSFLSPMVAILGTINSLQAMGIALAKRKGKEDAKNAGTSAMGMFANIVSAFSEGGIAGVIAGVVLATALVAALGFGIAAAAGAFNGSSTDKSASAINNLSNEIYKLTEKARSIDTITDSYDKLDNKIIKTIADQKEMNSLLEKAADELSDEEKDIYNSLTRDEDKLNYLKNISSNSTNEANSKRQQQLNKLNRMSSAKRNKILTSSDNNDYVLVQSAMYAIANNNLYEYIDGIEKLTDEEEAHWKSVEKVTQTLLEGVDATEAYNLANNPERIEELAKALGDLQAAYVDSNGANQITGVTDILSSDDYSLKEKVQAFRTAADALKNTELAQSFADTYQDLATFSSVFDDTLLDWMDDMGMTACGINNLGSALNKLGYDTEEATKKLAELFSEIQDGESLGSAILDVFGLDEMNETYTKILNAYEAAIGTTLLDVGQNVQSLKSQINTFYETAQKWSSMSDSEKTSFLSDNSTLFAGKDGAELLKAFESGDYNKIQAALQNNQELLNKTEQRIKEIRTQLEIETQRAESDRNEATIQYLQEQIAELEDVENLYTASLEIRLEQEQAYLDKYKEYLQKQKDELTKSLEDRKDAYQKYFDAVNQTADDEDFEQKESTLMANITKLASSTSADAINQSAKLEQSLKDLEDERLKTLREQAQEKIMSNLDDQVSQINDKFDELLDSNQAMLAALTGQLDNPAEFVSSLISSKITDGATALEVQDYISGLSDTYGNLIGTDIFKNIQVEERNNSLVLNVAGQSVPLEINDQQSVYDAIMAALRAVGAI